MCRISSHWRARRPETADQLCNVFPLPPPPYPPTPPPVCNPPSGTSHQCYACAKSEFVGVPGELRWQTTCVTCPSTPPPTLPCLPSQTTSNTSHQCYAAAESAYDGVPGELQWQTSGAPHHLHMAPAAKQPLPGGGKKKEGLVRRRKDPFVGSPSLEQATPAGLPPLAPPPAPLPLRPPPPPCPNPFKC